MDEINKLDVIRAALDCENSAFLFVVDNDGHIQFIASGKTLDKKDAEANVSSKLFAKCCAIFMETMNWQSAKLAAEQGEMPEVE